MKKTHFPCRMYFWKAGVCIVFLLWSALWAQYEDFEYHSFTDSSSGFTLPYRLLRPQQPKLATLYPLVVFLHGGGDVGTDNESQLTNFPECFLDSSNRVTYPCYIIAPQCPSVDEGWSSFPDFPYDIATPDEPPTATAAVLAVVDSLRGSGLNIDKSRIYITGFSLGGEGTFDILTRRPELVAAAIPICGIGDTAKVYLYKDIPLWIFHGSADSVNNVMYSRMIVAKLISLGAHPKYTEYEGMDHRCWDMAYAEPDLLPWLFAQNKRNQIPVLHPQKQTSVSSGRYCALRKRGRVELSWDSSVKPDAAEIYAPNGRMLHRYPMAGLNASTMSLPLPYAQGVLFVKFIKNSVTLHTEFVSPVR